MDKKIILKMFNIFPFSGKKADISVLIFVLFVIALCVFGIITFYSSSLKVKNNFISSSFSENILAKKQLIDFYIDKGKTNDEISKILGIKYDNGFVIEENYTVEKGFLFNKKKIKMLEIIYNYKV